MCNRLLFAAFVRRLFILSVCTVVSAACDTDNPTELQGPSLSDVQEQVFTPSCTGCHTGANASQGLDLTVGSAYESTVSVPSEQAPGLMRVQPGNATDSYLYIKVLGGDRMAPGTFQMPIGSELSDAQIRLIEEWIDGGAER